MKRLKLDLFTFILGVLLGIVISTHMVGVFVAAALGAIFLGMFARFASWG